MRCQPLYNKKAPSMLEGAFRTAYSALNKLLVATNTVAVVATEFLFKVAGIFVVAGLHTHHNAAVLDAVLVFSSVLLGNARAHQGAYQSTREATGTGTSQ